MQSRFSRAGILGLTKKIAALHSVSASLPPSGKLKAAALSNPEAQAILDGCIDQTLRLAVVLIRAGVMSIDMVEMGHTGQLPEVLTRCARSILDGLMETTI